MDCDFSAEEVDTAAALLGLRVVDRAKLLLLTGIRSSLRWTLFANFAVTDPLILVQSGGSAPEFNDVTSFKGFSVIIDGLNWTLA